MPHFLYKRNLEKIKKGEQVNLFDNNNIIERKIDIHLSRMKKLKTLHEMRLFKAENALLRNKFIEKQKINNYKNEYDRLRSTLSNNVFKRVVDLEKDNLKRDMWIKLMEESPQ